MLWVIANTPEAEIAGSPFARFQRLTEPAAYEQASRLWLSLIERDPTNARIVRNAGRFFESNEIGRSEELFARGLALEPGNPEWKERLDRVRTRKRLQAARDSKSLEGFESALQDSDDLQMRYHALPEMAAAALRAGEDGKARAYAEELLSLAEGTEWNRGHAVHEGNRILGHLALRAGDVEAAKQFLLRSGETQGSPVLNSFGRWSSPWRRRSWPWASETW